MPRRRLVPLLCCRRTDRLGALRRTVVVGPLGSRAPRRTPDRSSSGSATATGRRCQPGRRRPTGPAAARTGGRYDARRHRHLRRSLHDAGGRRQRRRAGRDRRRGHPVRRHARGERRRARRAALRGHRARRPAGAGAHQRVRRRRRLGVGLPPAAGGPERRVHGQAVVARAVHPGAAGHLLADGAGEDDARRPAERRGPVHDPEPLARRRPRGRGDRRPHVHLRRAPRPAGRGTDARCAHHHQPERRAGARLLPHRGQRPDDQGVAATGQPAGPELLPRAHRRRAQGRAADADPDPAGGAGHRARRAPDR